MEPADVHIVLGITPFDAPGDGIAHDTSDGLLSSVASSRSHAVQHVNLVLIAVDALPAEKRAKVSMPWSRFNSPEELRRDAEELMGFELSGLGRGVSEWCGQSEANTDRLVAWIRSVAHG